MGFIDNKNEVVNDTALFGVLNGLPKGRSTSSLESVNSKSFNLITFLIDLLSITCTDNKTLKGRMNCEASFLIIELLTEFFSVLTRILKDGIAKGIKAGLACSVNFTLPNLPQKIGFKTNIKNLDFNGLLKLDPTSTTGSMSYGKNATQDFNWFLHDLIQNGGSKTWKDILDLEYDKQTQDLTVSVNSTYISNGKTFDDFILDFTNSTDTITLEGFMAKLQNKLTGALSSLANTSIDQLVSIEMLDALQDKINSTDPCKADYQFEDSYFVFDNEDLLSMEDRANQKAKGVVNLDLGCGIVEASVSSTSLKNVFDNIRNNPTSKIIESSINSLTDEMTSRVGDKDKNLAKASLNTKFIESIPKVLTDTIMEPKFVILYQMCSKLVNGPLSTDSPNIEVKLSFDFAKATKAYTEYVTRESLSALLEIIFKLVKKEIIKLVTEFAIKKIKEQSKLKIKALKFLTAGVIGNALSAIPVPNTSKYV